MPNHLKQIRKKAGLTQVQLARLSSVPQTTISSIENGTTARPSVQAAHAIAKALSRETGREVRIRELIKL